MRRYAISLPALISLMLLTAWAAPKKPTSDANPFVKGMTVSCHGVGESWGSDAMVECMTDLKDLGVNWIAIHPYASIRADGTVGSSRMDVGLYRDPTWLTRPIKEAHKLGLKIMIKPHIAYWGSKFSWRGEIKFEKQEEWDRFFSTYTEWITMVAELSKDADAFVVGMELDATVHHEKQSRNIIKAVRAETDVPLTYAANWDSYERVKFWDALDVIGVQAYFPLVNHADLPTKQELERGWHRVLRKLELYGQKYDKKVLLAELGYNNSSIAAQKPWEYRTGGPNAIEVQRRCMNVALESVEKSDTIVGAFLWKWFPNSRRGGRNFIMSTPDMREVIGTHWGSTVETPETGE